MHSDILKNMSGRSDLAIVVSLLIIGVLTRIPFASRMIFEGDSARFAMAMREYDIAQMKPHAPGYILYIALAKFVNLFVSDSRLSMLGISIISSALTAVLLYYLARRMYDGFTAFTAAVLLFSSPLFWFNGEMPLTYALEGLFSAAFAYACFRVINKEKRWLFISAVVLGLATGVRQNIIIIFFPLWLFSFRKYSVKDILIAICIFGLTCLTWFAPMIILTGGLKKYLQVINAQYSTWVAYPAPFSFQIKERGKIFSRFMAYSLGVGLIPFIYYLARDFRMRLIKEDTRLKFLLSWIMPGILFFIGVNIWNPGHVVVILPPLFIMLSEAVKRMSGGLYAAYIKIGRSGAAEPAKRFTHMASGKIIAVVSIVLITAVNSYAFLAKDTPVSYSTIERQDSDLEELIRLTRANSEPDKTMLLAFFYSTQASIYLPDYRIYCPFPLIFDKVTVPIGAQNVYVSFQHQTTPKTYWIPTGFRIKPIVIPEGIDKIVLWESEVASYYKNPKRPLEEITSKINGTKIYVLTVKPEEKIYYDYHYLSVG